MELHERLTRRLLRPGGVRARLVRRAQEPHPFTVIGDLGPQPYNVNMEPADLRERVLADVRDQLARETGISRDDSQRRALEIANDILGHGTDRLRPRQPADGWPDRRQPQRHHRDAPARRCDPAGARQARPAPPPPEATLRRPRLPLPRGAARAPPPWHPTADSRAEDATRLGARQAALGRRTNHRLAAPVPAAARPLRNAATTSTKRSSRSAAA